VKQRPSKTRLRKLYELEGLSMRAIGKQLGVSPETVRRWLDAVGIPRRSPKEVGALAVHPDKHLPPLPKELLERAYVRPRRSAADVARTLGTTVERIHSSLEHHGLPRHGTVVQPTTFIDPAVVINLRTAHGWGYQRIATHLQVDRDRVRDILVQQGLPIRQVRSTLPQRAVDHLEERPVRKTLAGKVVTAITAILACGHQVPPGRNVTMKTDMSRRRYGCRVCAQKETDDDQ
jgi:transposase-like protein